MPVFDPKDDFYDRISGAFDQAAGTYDEVYQANRVMAWMRQESLATLRHTFKPGSRLLEVGCGTGEEALALSREHYTIVATDLSPAMIETARAKARASGNDRVTWLDLPAGRLADLPADAGPAPFDGAFSSFGALNCEPDLDRVAHGLHRLLCPGAKLVCSVMNRFCAWEIAWGLVHLRPKQAFRRLAGSWIEAGLASPEGRLTVASRYYGPRGFARAFAPHFRLQRVRAFPVLIPPPYLSHLWDRAPTLFARLENSERRLSALFPFSHLGDHSLLVLTRDKG